MKISGNIYLKGDKSLAHRAIMLASISNGESIIKNMPNSKDIINTIEAMRACGINIQNSSDSIRVEGNSFKIPEMDIDFDAECNRLKKYPILLRRGRRRNQKTSLKLD